ncbi:MAG: SBBP repeat-containing protein [Chloroflexi bacterium]|nr:SBBP repeat-containing protein [Chloroflexota bacterium]
MVSSILFRVPLSLLILVSMNGAFGRQELSASSQESRLPFSQGFLQYTAGGHVLGFAEDTVYLTGLDHALTVAFSGGGKSQPVETGAGIGAERGEASFGQVSYQNVWPGIDVIYTASKDGVAESVYLLAPRAQEQSIRLRYNVPVTLLKDGSLHFAFENGEMVESAPVAWQEVTGRRVMVSVRFEKLDRNEVGFVLGSHDPAYPVTIDPTYSWHTFYGSSANPDDSQGIAVDGNGNIYVLGRSFSSWKGPSGTAPLHAHSGNGDVVVIKLNSSGAYQWHTFYGSATNDETGFGIAVDGNGNIYVSGVSYASWNGSDADLPLNPYTGSDEIFVLKLSASGAYLWHTFYGSLYSDRATGIAVDTSGNAYVVGVSSNSWNGPLGETPLHPFSGGFYDDVVAIKLNSTGAYVWHTFFGSPTLDSTAGVTVDAGGNVLLTGYSDASWTGPTPQAAEPLHAHSGYYDLFALKLNSAGNYLWHTFYGSANADYGTDVAVDADGNAYVTGYGLASWNGPGGELPLHAFSSGVSQEIFVLKLNNAGIYQWHTFYGSTTYDYGYGIAVDGSGNVYVTGESAATWKGPGNAAPLYAFSGNYDIALFKLNSAGQYQWHTFYGSAFSEAGNGIAVDGNGWVDVAGDGNAAWNGPGNVSPLNPYPGAGDIVVIQTRNHAPTNLALSASSVTENLPAGSTVGSFTTTDPDAGDTFTYSLVSGTGSDDNAAFTISGNELKTAFPFNYLTKNNYSIRVRTTDSGSLTFEKTFAVTVTDATPIFADVPDSYWAVSWIERLYNAGITGGCSTSPLNYCPDNSVTRAQMAVFLLKGIHGSTYNPPTAQGTVFTDVPVDYWAAAWIEQLAAENITSGCDIGLYCPDSPVTRAQMAVFLLKSEHGNSYSPPDAGADTGFTDVPADYWAAAWIKQLAAEGITGGCATGLYCPDSPVTRAQMAVFLIKAFNLP